MIIQQRIARRMKSCMYNEELSINGLAEKLGLSKSSVADYLKEKGNPRADTIELIYERLGCSLKNFVEDKENENYDTECPDFVALIGRMNTIHPLLMPLVKRSYEMAEEIFLISDILNAYGSIIEDQVCPKKQLQETARQE